MSEFELDQYIDNLENTHDYHDYEHSLECAYHNGQCDSWGLLIPCEDNW